ncbi:protein kinase domain-containing protein [Nocardia abscessus]|uniref:protein kinase domain-containing protein n=1 Tax=Nocardia abscessus TaxID=120957 RepID=UPI002458AA0B|nr:protein kinase [Nocardia abscessus]
MVVGGMWQVGHVVDGRYRVDGLHENGGMGLVYRVRHLEWGTDLAVKCPRPEFFATAAQREQFIAEAQTWVSLGLHPNVCGCHYVRVLDGVPRVFAEYVAGGSLGDWVRDRRLYAGARVEVLARILDVAVQVARGLVHAHDRGLVHQDVKPANVLLEVTPSGVVAKVTDFGLARARALVAGPMVGNLPAGVSVAVSSAGFTPAYASPEQAAGSPVGRRTDVYSFAVSVLQLFTGEITWVSGAAAGAVLGVRRVRPEPGLPDIPAELADLLERSLSLDPAARPASMAEVATELIVIYRRVVGTPYPRQAPAAADLRADERNNRGVSLLDLGRTVEAEEMFAAALGADAQHPHATYNAGLLRWRRGECTDEDLLAAVDAAASSGADPDETRWLLAQIHRERGDHDEADALLDPQQADHARLSSGTGSIPWYDYVERDAYVEVGGRKALRSKPSIAIRFAAGGLRAVTTCEGVLRVWDAGNGRCLREWADGPRPEAGITLLDITGDGRYAITAESTTVRFWDVATGRCLRVFDAHESVARVLHWPNSIGLSGDGRAAVAAYQDGTVLAWEFPSGALRLTVEGQPQRATAAISHGGRLVLTAGHEDHTARLWDVSTGRCVRVLDSCERAHSAWLSADGNMAVVAGDGTIRVWEFRERRTRTFHGVGRLPRVSVYGRFVVSTDVDDTVRLWGLDDGRCLRTFRGNGSRVRAVHLDTEAGMLRSAWQDNQLRWWTVPPQHTAAPRLSKPRDHTELSLHAATVAELTERIQRTADPHATLELLAQARAVPGYEREPRLLAAWRALGRFAVRTGLRSAWPTNVLDAGDPQMALAVNPDGRVAVSGGVGGTVRVWDLDNETCLRVTEKQAHLVGAVGVSDDGSRAIYTTGGIITAWSVQTGERITVLHDPRLLGRTAFDRAARRALIARHDAIGLWSLDTGACEQELLTEDPEARVETLWLGSDLAVSGGSDQVVRIWDLNTGSCRHTLRGHTHHVLSVCLSPDDRYALSAGGYTDRTIRLWDTATGQCLRVFGDDPDHPRGVNSVPQVPKKRVRFSPDGQFAISGSSDTTVRIWDLTTGGCLRVLQGHRDAVNDVVISADASFALSTSSDGTLRRWELDWDLSALTAPRTTARASEHPPRKAALLPAVEPPRIDRRNTTKTIPDDPPG